MQLNVLPMDKCFERARLCGVMRVLYASTIGVGGRQKHFGDQPIDEDAPTFGSSQYAIHKVFNELQAKPFIQNYGMSISGIRPPNVTVPDKVRGSNAPGRCTALPAQEAPISFSRKSLMRLPIRGEDVTEVLTRPLIDSTQHPVYNCGGPPISLGALADLFGECLPEAQLSFESEGGQAESSNYLVDNRRQLDEFEYSPFGQRVVQIINEARQGAGLPR